jgi:glycosyltransferase involved in cell wall biosynthesis
MSESIENNIERPLVTFALFAYNQEKYIREAIEGALSQTYEPLEIIISDDGSSDKTGQIITNEISKYKGPHDIIFNKSDSNLGLGAQIKKISEIAKGLIIIMAAGDDISNRYRSEKIVKKFQENNTVFAVFSNFNLISENGNPIENHLSIYKEDEKINFSSIIKNGGGVGLGATYAYRRECFFWPWAYPKFIISEDRLLPLRANFLGGIKCISEPLISYRVNNNSLTANLIANRKLAKHNQMHLLELSNTIKFAKNQFSIPKINYFNMLRIINELKWMKYIDESNQDASSIGKIISKKLFIQWFNRDVYIMKIIKFFTKKFDRFD